MTEPLEAELETDEHTWLVRVEKKALNPSPEAKDAHETK